MSAAELIVENISWRPSINAAPILHPTSFHLEAGRILGIIGPNGSGKSSLLRTLYRYYRPSSGTVKIDGEDLWSMSTRAAAKTVAAVLQEQPSDFAMTARELTTLGRLPHRQSFSTPSKLCAEVVDAVLHRTNLAHLSDRQFGALSGGERQRVMMARALAQSPRLLVLDEPTNHLDIHYQLELLELVRDLNITVVISLHDLNMAATFCDDILVMQNGRSLVFGPPQEVLTEDLVSGVFRVSAQLETLSRSQIKHFSFELNS